MEITVKESREIVARLLRERRALEKFAEVLLVVDNVEQLAEAAQVRLDTLIVKAKDTEDRIEAYEKASKVSHENHEKAMLERERAVDEIKKKAEAEAMEIIRDARIIAESVVNEAKTEKAAHDAKMADADATLESVFTGIAKAKDALAESNAKVDAVKAELAGLEKIKEEARRALGV